jgi:hypothetical protein
VTEYVSDMRTSLNNAQEKGKQNIMEYHETMKQIRNAPGIISREKVTLERKETSKDGGGIDLGYEKRQMQA